MMHPAPCMHSLLHAAQSAVKGSANGVITQQWRSWQLIPKNAIAADQSVIDLNTA